jgi:ligand-binding sensor domain-containing protein/DNA-binding response OmpR family regulator/two-component sensor histidine kinase
MISWNKYMIFAIFFLQFAIFDAYSQIVSGFTKINVPGNISQSIIYSIAQDSFRNIWAGTEEGVIRYNSKDMFLYNKYKGLPANSSDRISVVYVDKKNRIWLGTEKGILQNNPSSNSFKAIGTNVDLVPNLVDCIIEKNNNELWIGAYNGLWKYDIENQKLVNRIADMNVLSLQNVDEALLVGTNTGLFYYDVKRNELESTVGNEVLNTRIITCIDKINNKYYIGTMKNGLYVMGSELSKVDVVDLPVFDNKFFRINSVTKIDENLFVVGTDGAGLIYIDSINNYLGSAVNNVNDPKSISSNGIYDILLSKENILWIATYGGGLNSINLNKEMFFNISHEINNDNSLIYNFTRAIHEDTEHRIWFGTKQGLSIWNRSEGKWINFKTIDKSSKAPDIILALEEDGNYMWAATYGNGVYKINKKDFSIIQYSPHINSDIKIELSKIYSLLKDSNNNIWLGGIDGPLHKIQPDGQIIKYSVTLVKDIEELRNGSILAVGRMGAYVIKNDSVLVIDALKPGQNNLDYTDINCALQDSCGNLILGTNGKGMVFYDIDSKEIKKVNISNGLPSDIVQAIKMMNDKDLWISTTRGIAHLILEENDTMINVYNKSDGMISNEYNYGSAAKLSDGLLIFGGVEGVSLFDPEEIKIQKTVPEIIFEDFKLFMKKDDHKDSFNVSINNINELILNFNDNSFSIKFVGVLHSAPSKVLYSWKMDGLNDIWSDPTNETQINFTNLSPGKYNFHLKASNRDGLWSKDKILSIWIKPPWWKTGWAYLFYTIAVLIAIGALFYMVNLYITKRNVEEQISFFNNITHELKTPLTILLSTIDSIPKKAEFPGIKKIKSTSRQLVSLFEQLLNFHLVTAGEQNSENITEIVLSDYFKKIISRFKPLLDEKLIKIEIINKSEINNLPFFYYDKYVLDKIVFNLLSNAIKYSKEGGSINIILNRKNEYLELSVSDDGIGIPKDQQKYILKKYYRGRNAINSNLPGTGLGLMIVKNLVEKDKGSIKFTSVENIGSIFTVKVYDKKKEFVKSKEIKEEKVQFSNVELEVLTEFREAKILIVEDNNELRKNLIDKLGFYFQVYDAENGKAGLDLAMEVFPDLIITDLIMPEMDGIEMAKALQDNINLNHIPIFMMTVLNSRRQKLESVESGISTYLEKPVDFGYLLAKIINTLNWSKKLREKYLHEVDVDNAVKFRTKKDAEFITKLENFILAEITEENLSVHYLCKYVNMSRTALYMKLKSMVDLSPQNFIIHTRLKYARKQFIETEMSIKEVAYSVGFSSPKYFSTSFKKLFGVSPTTFLKNLEKDVFHKS